MPLSLQIASLLSGQKPERSALARGEAELTFAELATAVDRLATALSGVQPGERVAVVAPNMPALVVGLFAVWRAGAVAVPLSARLRRFELERAFADAEPAGVVSVAAHAGFDLAGEIATVSEHTPSLRISVVLDELGEALHVSRRRGRDRAAPLAAEVAAILYTSGTTGEPRGALVSHALAGAMARNLADLLGEDASAPHVVAVPGTHAFGLGCLLCGIAAGARSVLVDVSTSLDPLLDALRPHQAVALHGTPALFGRLLRSGADFSLRTGLTAGSWCPSEVIQALDARGARILNLYGMTEIGAASSCRQDDSAATRYQTVGRALDGYELRVAAAARRGADGPVTSEREPCGEIQVRSPLLASGYLGRQWSQNELTDDGWFRTGDIGELDAAGNLTISGRAKEIIHVGGFNVFPAEVESFLLTHPAIVQAAVIGVAHPVLGESVRAFVAPVRDATLEPRDVTRFARAGIAGYKVPYDVRIVDELPLLPSGKPDRRELARTAHQDEIPPAVAKPVIG